MTEPGFIDAVSAPVDIDPETTALLIIDMQNATGNRHMGLGKMLEERGEAEQCRYRFDRIEQILTPNISRLADGFRSAGAKIVYITYGANSPDGSDVPAHIANIVKATNNIAGQKEHEIVAELTPKPGELVLNKTTQGAFRSTALDSTLRAWGIKTVVSTGVSTNNCVAMTSMEARELQYGVVLVSDATGTDSDALQESTLNMLRRLWARVMTTDDVLSALNSAT